MAPYTLNSSIYHGNAEFPHNVWISQGVDYGNAIPVSTKKKITVLSKHLIALRAATRSQHLLCLQSLLQNQLPLRTMGYHQN